MSNKKAKLSSVPCAPRAPCDAELNNIATVFHFTVDSEILNKTCEYSTHVELNNVKWRVVLRKKSTALAVYLIADYENNEKEWSCDAQAAIKLFQKDGHGLKCVMKELPKTTFERSNPLLGIDFIEWDDFLQNHVHEKKAKLEIEISTGNLTRKTATRCDKNHVSGTFHFIIKDAKNLTECYSSFVTLQGVRWKIFCGKIGEFLAVYLYGNENDIDINWSYRVYVQFKLVSFKEDVAPIAFDMEHEFGADLNQGLREFLKWTDFVDENKRYISRNQANLFVGLRVEAPTPIWDMQHKTLRASKTTLDCCVCLESFASGKIFATKCGHLLCKQCFEASTKNRKVCPTCQTATDSADMRPIYFQNKKKLTILWNFKRSKIEDLKIERNFYRISNVRKLKIERNYYGISNVRTLKIKQNFCVI